MSAVDEEASTSAAHSSSSRRSSSAEEVEEGHDKEDQVKVNSRTRSGRSYHSSTQPDADADTPDNQSQPVVHNGRQNTPPPSPTPLQNIQKVVNNVWSTISGSPWIKTGLLIAGLAVFVTLASSISGILDLKGNKNLTEGSLLSSWADKQRQLLQVTRNLRKFDFPSQFNKTFEKIYGVIEYSLMEEEPTQPSAFAILYPPSMKSKSFPLCFAKRISNIINRVFEPRHSIPTKELNLKFFHSGASVTDNHNEVKAYFDGGGKTVVVEEVEQMQESNLILFHAFCDNSRAYQKRAVFFFLIPVDESIYEKYEWDPRFSERISYDVLDKAWGQSLNEDQRPAYIARIAASSVLLKEGDTCTN